MSRSRHPCLSALFDAEWALLEAPHRILPEAQCPPKRRADTVFYLLRSGCATSGWGRPSAHR